MAPSISIAVDRRAGRHPRTSGAARRVYASLPARWRRLAARRDAGGATVEAMFATILLLTVVMFAIQAAVAWHATHIAQAAATRAATAAAGYQSSASAGDTAGRQTLAALGNGVLKNPTVSVTRSASTSWGPPRPSCPVPAGGSRPRSCDQSSASSPIPPQVQQ
jgi:hypothetical protein